MYAYEGGYFLLIKYLIHHRIKWCELDTAESTRCIGKADHIITFANAFCYDMSLLGKLIHAGDGHFTAFIGVCLYHSLHAQKSKEIMQHIKEYVSLKTPQDIVNDIKKCRLL